MISNSEKKMLNELKCDKYPDVAEDKKGFFILWADGRGQVGYKNKKHAIQFIEQGDHCVISVVYRNRKKGETVRNLFTPDKSSNIHDMLYKEAQTKREYQKSIFVNNLLLADAEKHLHKRGMARQSGGSTLRNSGWNTNWHFVDPSSSIENAKKQVKQKAASLFKQENFTNTVDLRPNPISFLFRYIRTIIPDKHKESAQKAKNALVVLDKVLNGFKQFQQDLEQSNIPLSPYFMTGNFSKINGGVSSSVLKDHIISESQRAIQLPNNKEVFYYKQHISHLQSNDNVKISNYQNVNRVFSMREVDNIPNSTWLIHAINDKINNGYTIDVQSIYDFLVNLLEKSLLQNNLDYRNQDPLVQKEIKTYDQHYKMLFTNIIQWWKSYKDQQLDTGNMTAFMLRIVLKNLKHTGYGIPAVRQDEFRILGASSSYMSNGWDSSRDNPSVPMLTLSPMRQLPSYKDKNGNLVNEIVYDRGNGNISYDHLVLNWKDGLDRIFQKYGSQANKWLQILEDQNVLNYLAQQSPEAYEAWQNIKNNRTGAENILTLLERHPSWNSFNNNHLQKSLASELRSVNELLKNGIKNTSFNSSSLPMQIQGFVHQIEEMAKTNPIEAGEYLRSLSSELCSLYHDGLMNWDNLTLALHAINAPSKRNPNIKSNGISSLRQSEKKSMIDSKGFEYLKQYGYQIAKMMDFLYAIMVRSCHEKINTRQDGLEENFYGHQYSTSSGKSEGGDIILRIEYEELLGYSTNNGIEINEKQRFTLGQKTKSFEPVILRSSLPWSQMADAFNELYPEAGFNVINEPVNNNLKVLEAAIKSGLNEIRGQIQVIYHNNIGYTEILSDEIIQHEQMNLSEDAQNVLQDISSEETQYPQLNQNKTLQLELNPTPKEIENPAFTTEGTYSTLEEELTPAKPMVNDSLTYLHKRNNKGRSLFKQKIQTMQLGSIEERLSKIANRLDKLDEYTVSDKIDLLLKKISEVKNAQKKSNI